MHRLITPTGPPLPNRTVVVVTRTKIVPISRLHARARHRIATGPHTRTRRHHRVPIQRRVAAIRRQRVLIPGRVAATRPRRLLIQHRAEVTQRPPTPIPHRAAPIPRLAVAMVGEVGVLMAAVAAGVRTAAVAVEEEAHTAVVVEADLTGAEVRTEAALTDDKFPAIARPKNWGGFFFADADTVRVSQLLGTRGVY